MLVNPICGFLGSGKTTLMRRIIGERGGREPMAVIVNEFGDVGIDGAILSGHSVDMIEISSGCLCCTLKGSLVNALEELRDKKATRRVVIEATGVAQPGEMLDVLADPALKGSVDVGPMVTVVDAATDQTRTAVNTALERLLKITAEHKQGRHSLLNWLRLEFGIDKPSQKLQALPKKDSGSATE